MEDEERLRTPEVVKVVVCRLSLTGSAIKVGVTGARMLEEDSAEEGDACF